MVLPVCSITEVSVVCSKGIEERTERSAKGDPNYEHEVNFERSKKRMRVQMLRSVFYGQ